MPPPEIGEAGLRALKTVALADGEFHDLERQWLESVQRYGLGKDLDIDALELISGEELAQRIPPGEFRDRVVRGSLLVALIDTEASKEELEVIEAFASALDVDRAPLRAFGRIVSGHFKLVRLDILRRAFIGKRIKQHVAVNGIRGLAQIAKAAFGLEAPKVTQRYLTLEGYASGTLGRAYFDFIRGNGFGFPGEKDGAPEPIAFHDCIHVLAEYGTTADEEVYVLAYQGGFQNYDPFFTVLFGISQFHLGVQVSPIIPAEKFNVHPDGLIKAFMRGTQCNCDLSDGWDPWDDFATPLVELRDRYNIVPREDH